MAFGGIDLAIEISLPQEGNEKPDQILRIAGWIFARNPHDPATKVYNDLSFRINFLE